MRQPELKIRRARGFLLIVAVLVLVVVAIAIAAMANMTSADIRSSSAHAQSEQAYFAATSGLEYATGLLKSGTACGSLPTAAAAVGAGSFTLSATANNPASTTVGGVGVTTTAQTTIPATSTVGYAAHGRIVIDGEQIRYTGKTATTFTGAIRGYGGTAAATHLATALVLQDQCLVRATGTSVVATRVMESAIQNGLWSDFLNDTSTAVPTAAVATLHTLNAGSGLVTSFPAGDNIIIAIVALRNTSGTVRTIIAGNLRLRNVTTAATLASNLYNIDIGGAGAPSASSFNQKTFFFVHRETGAAASQTYRIEGQASGAGITAEVKIVVLNGPPVSSWQATTSANAGSGAFNTILTHVPPAPYPAGDNIVIAAVQWNNNSGANRILNAGNLRLRNSTTATTLASNTFNISIRANAAGRANDNGAMLLVGLDTNAPANPTYVVQANATGTNLQVEAKLIVISAVGSDYLPGGVGIPLAASPTSLGTLSTSFPALRQGAANIAIAATQYDTGNTARSIAATNEDLVFSGSPQAWNEFQMDLCATGTSPYCTDFAMGLLGRQTIAEASPSFSVQTTPSSTAANRLNGEAKILGIHLAPVTDRIEVLP